MASNTGQTIVALLTGAIIGAGVGILFAPDKGSETREKISKEAKKAQKNVKEKYHEASSMLSDKAQVAKKNFDQKLNNTLSFASNKADDILLAMEEKLEELRKQNTKLQKKSETKEA